MLLHRAGNYNKFFILGKNNNFFYGSTLRSSRNHQRNSMLEFDIRGAKEVKGYTLLATAKHFLTYLALEFQGLFRCKSHTFVFFHLQKK